MSGQTSDEGEFQTHEVGRGAGRRSSPLRRNKSDVILGAIAALLGEAGLDAQREEQERIADTGAVALVVTLVEHYGRTLAVMVTVIHSGGEPSRAGSAVAPRGDQKPAVLASCGQKKARRSGAKLPKGLAAYRPARRGRPRRNAAQTSAASHR